MGSPTLAWCPTSPRQILNASSSYTTLAPDRSWPIACSSSLLPVTIATEKIIDCNDVIESETGRDFIQQCTEDQSLLFERFDGPPTSRVAHFMDSVNFALPW